MEKHKIVFKINVLAIFPMVANLIKHGSYMERIEDNERYNVTFKVILKNNEYYVVYNALRTSIGCEKFSTKADAVTYISVVMKEAMKGSFIYKTCVNCKGKILFPDIFCSECSFSIPLELYWQVPKMKNKHKTLNK